VKRVSDGRVVTLIRRFLKAGVLFVRYADDCNIYVKSLRAGRRVLEGISRYLTSRLKLKVNEAKSAVGRPWERKFLGFSFSRRASGSLSVNRQRSGSRRRSERSRDAPVVGASARSAHGPWRLSRSPALAFALPGKYFDELGVPRLYIKR
jgi:hypothetical protein